MHLPNGRRVSTSDGNQGNYVLSLYDGEPLHFQVKNQGGVSALGQCFGWAVFWRLWASAPTPYSFSLTLLNLAVLFLTDTPHPASPHIRSCSATGPHTHPPPATSHTFSGAVLVPYRRRAVFPGPQRSRHALPAERRWPADVLDCTGHKAAVGVSLLPCFLSPCCLRTLSCFSVFVFGRVG